MKFLRRLLGWNLLFLVGFLLCFLLDATTFALQVRVSVIEEAPSRELGRQIENTVGARELRTYKLPSFIGQSIHNGDSRTNPDLVSANREFKAGRYKEAINFWEQALPQISSGDLKAAIHTNLSRAYRETGRTDRAIVYLEQAMEIYRKSNDRTSRRILGGLLAERAQIHSEMGQHKQAIDLLETVIEDARRDRDRFTEAAAMGSLGYTYSATGNYDKAVDFLQSSLKAANELQAENSERGRISIDAIIQTSLNNLGNTYEKRSSRYRYQAELAQLEGDDREKIRLFYLAQQDTAAARQIYEQSIQLGASSKATLQALLNLNILLKKNPTLIAAKVAPLVNADAIASNRTKALTLLEQIPDSHDKAFALINLAEASEPAIAAKLLSWALAVSRNIGDARTESFALGSLAQMYEESDRYSEAIELNRQAQFIAQKVNAIDSLYRWQWQAGRIMKATGERNKAIQYYEQSIVSLQSIRLDLLAANKDLQFDFRDSVEPIYRQLMKLLLQTTDNGKLKNQNLNKVTEVLELLKLAELQNYFGDDCVQIAVDKEALGKNIAETSAAIIYSVILSNRTEIIVRLPDGKMLDYGLKIGQEELEKEIDKLRLLLEKRATDEYFPQSEKIYDWLIRPLAKDLELAKVKTLVFINDGVLRKVPMAALYDGKEFLVQKYAIATTPSLSLTASKSAPRRDLRALSVGLTVERPPFAPLINVKAELAKVQDILGGIKLIDSDFTVDRFQMEMRRNNFPVVHMATHGKFGVDAASTFLLGFDTEISIDEIDKLLRVTRRNADPTKLQPIELLTLSACQTAVGDNRSALGIAGVAVRAGAKSALASLWFINDEATVPLIEEFYTQLRQYNVTKAEALQKAQLKLIASDDYSHPAVWSPLILIGNWL